MSAGIVAEPRLIEVDRPAARAATSAHVASHASRRGITLAAAVLGFFVITLDAVVVNMVPLELFRSCNVSVSAAVGFAFVIGYYGLPFVMSLYLQQVRGLSSLGTGLVFVPMMVVGVVVIPFSARLAERLTPRGVITSGLGVMAAGLAIVGCAPASTPVWALAALMAVVGLAGPFVIPPITAVLLNSVPGHQAGTASGVFNTAANSAAHWPSPYSARCSRARKVSCTDCASAS